MDKGLSLVKADISEFDFVYDALERNFIPEERRDREDALALLMKGAYTVYHILDEAERVGFITVWELSDSGFIEHFVVYEAYRNRGYGASALELLKGKYKKLVLEAEPPTDGMPARRVAFYERCGFARNEQYYFQPPYREGGEGVELVLMSWPTRLDGFQVTVREIYANVYNKNFF